MSLSVGARFGPYDITGTLGAGGMGVVYRAHDSRLGRDVAIKTLPESSASDATRLQRFQQEAQTAGALNHPNVLSVFDVGQEHGTPYLVTELLEGQTLRARLAEGPLPPRKAVEVMMQAAAGLAAVHEKGIVHRDLKPENLFLTRDGRLKVLDFGVARALEETPRASATLPLTQSGAVMGTAGYMAPEQVRGRPADARSDVFALGAILYEALTGALAFPGETPVERGYAVLNADPRDVPALGEVPAALVRVMRRCLEKAPEQRFQHARDLVFALEAITDVTGPVAQLAPGSQKAPGRRAGLLAVGALAALAVALLGALLVRQRPAPPEPPARVESAPAAAPVPRRVSFRNGVIHAARFSGGGRGLVYSGSFEGEPPQVVAGVLDSAQTRPVSQPWWLLMAVSPTGEAAVAELTYQPGVFGMVLSRMALAGGAPRPLVEGVVAADFGADGSLMVLRTDGRRFALEYPPGHLVLETTDGVSFPRLSPRGDRIAYLRHSVPFDDRGHAEIVDLGGQVLARSAEAWTARGVAWPPGGEEVWFTAGDRSNQRSLRALTVAGKERELFTAPGSMVLQDVDAQGRALVSIGPARARMFGRLAGMPRERSLSWLDGSNPVDLSADGRALLFIEGFGAMEGEIQTWLRTADGAPPVLISKGWGRALSPDQRWALLSPRPPFTTLSLVPTGPGESRSLREGAFSAILRVFFFADGRRVAISARDASQRLRLYVQEVPAGVPAGVEASAPGPRLVADQDLVLAAPPSPDGKWLAAVADGQPVRVAVESGAVERLPGLARGDAPLQWSSDGKALFVTHRKEQRNLLAVQLLRYELATAKLSVVQELGPADPVGMDAVERGLLSPDAKHYVYQVSQRLDELYVVDGLR